MEQRERWRGETARRLGTEEGSSQTEGRGKLGEVLGHSGTDISTGVLSNLRQFTSKEVPEFSEVEGSFHRDFRRLLCREHADLACPAVDTTPAIHCFP